MTAPSITTAKPRRSHTEKREETRKRILDAALDIMVADGIRAVRNRDEAKRAGGSLGSPTYHFDFLEDLIISHCNHWGGEGGSGWGGYVCEGRVTFV